MVKIIIVDDEKNTREGLKKCIPWKSMGIEIVGEAEDGIMALDLSFRLKPDIILCDIRMPRMNGIEFATRLREKLQDCKIIFLSGYSDKEYLISAIHLKAVSFIEKPVNIKELKSILDNTASMIIEERQKKDIENEKNYKIEKSVPIVAQYISLSLINNNNLEDLTDKLKLAGLNLPLSGQYMTLLLKFIKSGNMPSDQLQGYFNKILKIIDSIYIEESLTGISGVKDALCIISHILVNKSLGDTFIKSVLEKIGRNICTEIGEIKRDTFIIGAGRRVKGLENIHHSYREAAVALQQSFFSTADTIVFFEEATGEPYIFNTDLEKQFIEHLKMGDMDAAMDFITRLGKDISNHRNTIVDYVKNAFYNLLLHLYSFAEERGADIFEQKDKKNLLRQNIEGFSTLNELKDFAIVMIEKLFQCINRKNNTSKAVYEVMKYIQAHFSDNELSIKTISGYLHLTDTYLCMLFKNATGKTINDYITEIRIEKSKELLKSRGFTLYKIASSIGYGNSKYYAAIFKKITGMTPSEYREKI